MKTIMQAIAVGLLCFCFSLQGIAQSELSVENSIIDVAFSLPDKGAIDAKPAVQKPVEIPQPLILTHPKNGKCYAFRCKAGEGCETCGLFWKDRNGDGKINPRKELRCRCKADPEKECRIRGREVPCQD